MARPILAPMLAGGSYPDLGAPFGAIPPYGVTTTAARLGTSFIGGMVPALDNVPYDDGNNGYYRGGMKAVGMDNSHFGSFQNHIYQIWGRARDVDTLNQQTNRALLVTAPGDQVGHVTNTINGVRYYGLVNYCCEGRGAENAYRDITLPAAFGGDDRSE